jgi:RNA polymerase sigma factor FliA
MAGRAMQTHEMVSTEQARAVMDLQERDAQIQDFLPFIKYQALRMASRLPHFVDVHDLIHAGVLGLLDALEKYDSSRGTQLKTYAEFRIRGAILDELRAADWASRSTRDKMKRLDAAYSSLEQEHQRSPTEEEVAHLLGLEMEEFHRLVLDARGVGLISIEELISKDPADSFALRDTDPGAGPHESYVWKEMQLKVRDGLGALSERERMVLTLYYYEELTMKEIGLAMGVTESRVSQIHAQALLKLKARFKRLG